MPGTVPKSLIYTWYIYTVPVPPCVAPYARNAHQKPRILRVRRRRLCIAPEASRRTLRRRKEFRERNSASVRASLNLLLPFRSARARSAARSASQWLARSRKCVEERVHVRLCAGTVRHEHNRTMVILLLPWSDCDCAGNFHAGHAPVQQQLDDSKQYGTRHTLGFPDGDSSIPRELKLDKVVCRDATSL